MTRAIAKVVALLSLVPLVQVGVTAAATEGSRANSSEALKGRVVIECEGHARKYPARPPRGSCTITGAITDRGKFVDDDVLRHNPHGRVFFGAKGTIHFSVYRERRGHWRIIEGTQSYAGLRGRGREALTRSCPGHFGCDIGLTMTGTVSQSTRTPSTSPALRGEVRIHLRGFMKGPQFAAFGRGRFTASGAITDRGRFVDEFRGIRPPGEPHLRILRGAKGTLRIEVDRLGRWRITEGTRAYAGLGGRGSLQGKYRFTGIDATMIGTVWR